MRLLIFLLFPLLSFAQFGAGVTATMTASAPRYGMLVNSTTLSNEEKADIVKDSFGCDYARTAIVLSQWNGSSSRFEIYDNKNLKQVVNFNYYPNSSGEPFISTPQRITTYSDTVALVLEAYPQIEIVVVENEEQNQNYHDGPITDYCEMLKAVWFEANPRGIKVANGGIAGVGLDIKVYRWLVTKYGQSAADSYGNAAMSNAQINAAETVDSNPTLETAVKQVDTVISYRDYYDYFNVHGYEIFSQTNNQSDTVTQVSLNVFRYIKEFVEELTGRPVITNETGQRNNSQPDLVTNMMNLFYRLGFEYVLWFNGDSVDAADARALSDQTTGEVFPNGDAFINFINTHK